MLILIPGFTLVMKNEEKLMTSRDAIPQGVE